MHGSPSIVLVCVLASLGSGCSDCASRAWTLFERPWDDNRPLGRSLPSDASNDAEAEATESSVAAPLANEADVGRFELSPTGRLAADVRDIEALAFSGDGRYLAAGGADHVVRIFRSGSWELVRELEGHIHVVRSLVFSPDSRHLISGSCDDSILVWDVATGRLEHAFRGQYLSQFGEPRQPTPDEAHRGCVTSLALTADGRFLASGSNDRTVRIWDMETRTAIGRLNHDDYVTGVGFRPQGDLLAFVDFRPSVRVVLWNRLSPTEPLRDLELPGSSHSADGGAGFSANDYKNVVGFLSDERLVTGSGDGALRIWSVPEGNVEARLPTTFGPVFAVALHPAAQVVASGHQTGTVAIWDLRERRLLGSQQRAPNIAVLAFSSDGGLLASASFESAGVQVASCAPVD